MASAEFTHQDWEDEFRAELNKPSGFTNSPIAQGIRRMLEVAKQGKTKPDVWYLPEEQLAAVEKSLRVRRTTTTQSCAVGLIACRHASFPALVLGAIVTA